MDQQQEIDSMPARTAWNLQAFSVVSHLKCDACGVVDWYGRSGTILCKNCGFRNADMSGIRGFTDVKKEYEDKYRARLDWLIKDQISIHPNGMIMLPDIHNDEQFDDVLAMMQRMKQRRVKKPD